MEKYKNHSTLDRNQWSSKSVVNQCALCRHTNILLTHTHTQNKYNSRVINKQLNKWYIYNKHVRPKEMQRERGTVAKFLFDGDGDDVVIESIHNHPVLLFSLTILLFFFYFYLWKSWNVRIWYRRQHIINKLNEQAECVCVCMCVRRVYRECTQS